MAKWYKQVFEELWKEANSTDDTTDDTKDDDKVDETDKIAARPTRPDKADAEIDYNAELKPEDAEIKFFEKAKKDLFTAKEWEELNKVEGKVDYVDKALNELKKQLADNYKSYDYYLNSAYETQLISKYKRELSKDFNPDDAAIQAEYERYVSLNKEKFSIETEANYKTAISSSLTNTVYHRRRNTATATFSTFSLSSATSNRPNLKTSRRDNPTKQSSKSIAHNLQTKSRL